ncbi:sulfite exporter TauE/SafE family protein [Isoptericola sp. NEAU-Y5]|uniref:Probable membrane transporter protein n=1 Tax=Isoptericola luteus TaxID=2879484 RepID=A0ABS7ZIQ7_9MICO|nr:sulfite exporter TauE/SafE family protein [Isoptericola sp. NEAU-Y5]MCA5894808.1 sulfite exporter TauE/SafE family protein [Isoptericola sp. NEAU-Y5]
MLALLVLAILVGGALQRVTGMGFGLVAGPFIVLLVGPLDGVLFVNLAGAIASLLILGRVVRDVEWRTYAWLAATSVLVTVPAALLLREASAAALEITVGAVVVVAMTLAVVTNRLRTEGRHPLRRDARWPLVLTGTASGFGSVAAGIGGPPVAIYSVLSGWDPRRFAATAQPYFATNAVAAIVSKVVFADATFPAFDWWQWVVVLGAVVGGLVIGDVLAPRVSTTAMRRGLIVLAYLGGAATLVRGLLHLG